MLYLKAFIYLKSFISARITHNFDALKCDYIPSTIVHTVKISDRRPAVLKSAFTLRHNTRMKWMKSNDTQYAQFSTY